MKNSNYTFIFLVFFVNHLFSQDKKTEYSVEPFVHKGSISGSFFGGMSDHTDFNGSNYTDKGGRFFGLGLCGTLQYKKWNFKLMSSINNQLFQQFLIIPLLNENKYQTLNTATNNVDLSLGFGRRFNLNENTGILFIFYFGGHYRDGNNYQKQFMSSFGVSPIEREVILNWASLNDFATNASIDFSVETKLKKHALIFHAFYSEYYFGPNEYSIEVAPAGLATSTIHLSGSLSYTPRLFGVGIGLKF